VTIVAFQERFATEEACREYLFACRWPDGFRCRRCGGGGIGVMHAGRRVWQCKRCGTQTSVTAGTMMLHKLRAATVAPQREPLKREVEIDEFFLGGYEQGLRGGRARGKKALCGVVVEVRGQGSGRVRLQVLADASANTLGSLLKVTTEAGAIVHTDAWHGYDRLAAEGWDHRRRNQSTAPAGDEPYLPRAHRAISNLKAWLHGTHRWASPDHLHAYLNEYVFRHNRRGNPHAAFQTLLGLSSNHQPVTYRQIIDRAA
jgi:transposase-like protein